MPLSGSDEDAIWIDFIARQPGVIATYDKPALKVAAGVIDTWITNNQANFISFLQTNAPAFAANSTPMQKTLMFIEVLLRRQGLI